MEYVVCWYADDQQADLTLDEYVNLPDPTYAYSEVIVQRIMIILRTTSTWPLRSGWMVNVKMLDNKDDNTVSHYRSKYVL